MRIENREPYDQFVEREEAPLFFQSWYLDLIFGTEEWNATFAYRGKTLLGVLPYAVKGSGWMKRINQPALIKYMGPFLSKQCEGSKIRNGLLKDLIEQLPSVMRIEIQCLPELQSHLPFYWQGYKQQTLYTYMLNGIQDLERVWQGISSNYRNNKIKKADSQVVLDPEAEIEDLILMNDASFKRQGIVNPINNDFLRRYLSGFKQS